MPVVESPAAFVRSGKVRDLYRLDDERLLLVASDRISAFDVVLPTPIPDKGRVLTGLSRYWFAASEAAGIVPNHLLGTDPSGLPEPFAAHADELRGRTMICRRARVLPVEVIVRGYLSGSGWKDYRATGAVCGIVLPEGLRESDRLPQPIMTPSTKAEVGHDQNIGYQEMVGLIGTELADRVREVALALYRFGAERAERAGIILADTKFEFGLVEATGELLLIDEVMTPDSSRFWDAGDYQPGRAQASYDKQFVRDWLERQDWDKTPPGPELPADVVAGTRQRYVEAFERITGGSFDDYLAQDRVSASGVAV
ncbi:MAG TPA: phosphoribosylaminoimidazolesuccinocarboxamide synthase [Candidatus Limnocylindrales bacterium]|nr:phosphoribosylaminoimidazolesuccinocarboxamide synthase [Candidatus Limnocylindrales bacterium]